MNFQFELCPNHNHQDFLVFELVLQAFQILRIHHFYFFKEYIKKNNIKARFWLAKDSYHVDAMFKYPDEYGIKLKNFFEEHLNN